MKQGASDFFNASRWIASFMVLIYHARGIIFPPLGPSSGKLAKTFFLLTAFGHEAVMVFFVLSGLLVGGLTIAKLEDGRFSLPDYSLHRLCRIYVVFVPALIATALIDHLSLSLFGDSALLHGHPARINPDSLSLQNFAAHLAMLYGLGADRFGSNGAIWSLVNEWWYYVVFGLAAGAWSSRRIWAKCLGVSAILGLLLFLPPALLALGGIWCLGIAAFLVARSITWSPPMWLSLSLFAATSVIAHALQSKQPDPFTLDAKALALDFAVGVTFAIVCVSAMKRLQRPLIGRDLHRQLADFSYSLYLIHIPILIFICAGAQQILSIENKPAISATSLVIWALCCLGAIIGAIFLYLISEKHTNAVRRFVGSMLRVPTHTASPKIVS